MKPIESIEVIEEEDFKLFANEIGSKQIIKSGIRSRTTTFKK